MAPRYMSYHLKLLLTLAVVLIFVIPTASMKQRTPKKRERNIYVIKNIGIKLCQLKCAKHGQCAGIEDIETLTCHLLRDESKTKKESSHLHVQNYSCTSSMCSFSQRCLKTRSGKEVCVQGNTTPSPADRRLYSASKDGDLESVKRILTACHVNINTRGGKWSRTPVMEAARWGHRDVVEFLVGRGADMTLVDKDGDNVLHVACLCKGDLETMTLILSLHVVDINSRGEWSRTPVMAAAQRGHRDVVEFLVGRGANVSLVDSRGYNVLHLACIGGHLETVKLILSLGVMDVNARDNFGKTAADRARKYRFGRRKQVFDLLLSHGAH